MKKIAVIFTLLFTLTACGDGFGAKEDNDPEKIAVAFVESIYQTNNLDYAVSVSSPRLASLLKRYRTNRNVQKNLFGQMYDKVTIEPEGAGRAGRVEFAKQTSVNVLLEGTFNNDKIIELRQIKMVNDGGWVVDSVEKRSF